MGIDPHIVHTMRQVVTAPITYTKVIPALTVKAPLPPIHPLIFKVTVLISNSDGFKVILYRICEYNIIRSQINRYTFF